MTALSDKTILILSPQYWGKMFVSKHHYAIQLARQGNRVYFLNPPVMEDPSPGKKIVIEPSGIEEGLFFIHHRLSFPYNIKFHFIGLFHALMKPHVRRILRTIGQHIDIVWSFDLGNLYPFRLFPRDTLKIFHPVDEPLNQAAIDSAKGGEVILSVTNEILDKYVHCGVPRYFINHGIAADFLRPVNVHKPAGDPVRVGLSGNFLRGDLDREILLEIIHNHPTVIFECWGSYNSQQANLASSSDGEAGEFIRSLQSAPNVVLHGAISARELAAALHQVDAFLICYDIKKDQSGGTNYHKIMEYLSTGKVIISNNVTTYKGRPELVQMVAERDHNGNLPALFAQVISRLAEFNSPSLQEQRIGFAAENTYSHQIEKIEKIIF